jgi:hypothetical protein
VPSFTLARRSGNYNNAYGASYSTKPNNQNKANIATRKWANFQYASTIVFEKTVFSKLTLAKTRQAQLPIHRAFARR